MIALASDFDNTIFFKEDEKLTRENVLAIKRFVDKGFKFCIITGRNYSSVKRRIDEYKIPYHFLICDDGAKIFYKNDQELDTVYLEENTAKKIVKLLKNEKWHFYLDDGYKETDSFKDCVKIVVDCDDDNEKDYIVNYIKEKVDVHIYASRKHVNIINKDVNKKNALEKLIKNVNISFSQLYVIGDNYNDYEMLKVFNGAVIKKHNSILDKLNKEEFDTISSFIDFLLSDNSIKNQ